MKKLIAQRPVLYMGRSYERGAALPSQDQAMTEAWLRAGSAVWLDDGPQPGDTSEGEPAQETQEPADGEEPTQEAQEPADEGEPAQEGQEPTDEEEPAQEAQEPSNGEGTAQQGQEPTGDGGPAQKAAPPAQKPRGQKKGGKA